ncbi:MAG TPA: hypothetical protein VLS28_04695 [Candidatus Sulfomarinibacteraceae bacterium]|nr:hypothetical protein [Candidatus Sulfomarinibacteraceae bacterium]
MAIAAEIRERGLDPARVRILVSGGHGDPVSFDVALRAHLEGAAPGLELGGVRIVRAAMRLVCAHCAALFPAIESNSACQWCGGPGIPRSEPESVELEWDEPPPLVPVMDWGDPRDRLGHAAVHELGAPHDHPEPARDHGDRHPAGGPDRPDAHDRRLSTPAIAGGRL